MSTASAEEYADVISEPLQAVYVSFPVVTMSVTVTHIEESISARVAGSYQSLSGDTANIQFLASGDGIGQINITHTAELRVLLDQPAPLAYVSTSLTESVCNLFCH